MNDNNNNNVGAEANDTEDGGDTLRLKENTNITDVPKVESKLKEEVKTMGLDCDNAAFSLKGNITIIDETKVESKFKEEVKTTGLDCDNAAFSLKGNIAIIDETKVESTHKEKHEENCEITRNHSGKSSEDESEHQLKDMLKCKEKIIPNDSSKEEDTSDPDSVTDSDHSLEKGNETMNETLHADQAESETPIINTNPRSQNDHQNNSKLTGKPTDNVLKIKTAVKSLQTALQILEKNDQARKAPLVNSVEKSKAESSIQAEGTRYIPFRESKLPFKSDISFASPEGKTSEIRSYNCNFCASAAMFTCKICKYLYCFKCTLDLHPYRGVYKSHKVIPITGAEVIEQHETCKDHGLVAQLFCSYCEKKRCVECANTKCFLHFKGRLSRADIDKEKALLVEEMERSTTKLSFLGRYKEFVENECDKIEMTGLFRREQIRQEFVSLHELLINKEDEMLKRLDQDVKERIYHVRDTLHASVLKLEREDALLTTTVTDLVQSEDDARFIEECVKAKEMCGEVDQKISAFNADWAKNSKYRRSQILDNPFSMLLEKKQLLEKLDSAVSFVPEVTFVETTMLLNADSGPWHISDNLQIPVAPPSTEVQYTVQLSVAHRKVVFQKDVKDLKEISLNTKETVEFESGSRYLVKISPTYNYTVGTSEQYSETGHSAYMLIVVNRELKHPDTRKGKGRRRNIFRLKMKNEI